MRKFLIAAGLAITVIGSLAAPRTEAMPLAPNAGMTDRANIIEQVAFCFYFDGWNGPGMYQCGYRNRRGQGWHGPREERRENYRGGYERRPLRCPPHYTVQDGVCKPYRGY